MSRQAFQHGSVSAPDSQVQVGGHLRLRHRGPCCTKGPPHRVGTGQSPSGNAIGAEATPLRPSFPALLATTARRLLTRVSLTVYRASGGSQFHPATRRPVRCPFPHVACGLPLGLASLRQGTSCPSPYLQCDPCPWSDTASGRTGRERRGRARALSFGRDPVQARPVPGRKSVAVAEGAEVADARAGIGGEQLPPLRVLGASPFGS